MFTITFMGRKSSSLLGESGNINEIANVGSQIMRLEEGLELLFSCRSGKLKKLRRFTFISTHNMHPSEHTKYFN